MPKYNRKCPVCGSLFYVPSTEWVYQKVVHKRNGKRQRIYYCSWKCYNIVSKPRKVVDLNDYTE